MFKQIAIAACAGLLLAETMPAREAGGADRQFRQALELLESADNARDAGENSSAVPLYREALAQYTALSSRYPDWQPRIVAFRIAYCNEQIETILRRSDRTAIEMPDNLLPAEDAAALTDSDNTQNARSAFIARAAREFLLENKPQEARDVLIEGLHISPDDPLIRLLLGITQCRLGRHADAVFLLTELLEELPANAVGLVALSAALSGIGDHTGAEQRLREALNAAPGLIEAHINLAQLLLLTKTDKREEAARHYATARRLGAKRNQQLEKMLQIQ